jgi:hypothetical protein
VIAYSQDKSIVAEILEVRGHEAGLEAHLSVRAKVNWRKNIVKESASENESDDPLRRI